jgi:tetratricopeptide (TPR) repeat protein
LAIHYATKAEEFFSKHKGYEVKTGACKNILGLACITLEQHELAEEYLLDALEIFKKAKEDLIIVLVRHNLGLLYADQDLSEVAVRHLTEAFNEDNHITTTYLLAREHYKLKNIQEVEKYIEEGLKSDDEKYRYHFSILKAKNDNLPIEDLEGVFLQAIEYFKERELWKDVIIYSEEIAGKWFDVGNESKISTYFHMNYEARQIFKKKESLK